MSLVIQTLLFGTLPVNIKSNVPITYELEHINTVTTVRKTPDAKARIPGATASEGVGHPPRAITAWVCAFPGLTSKTAKCPHCSYTPI
jgi:hypothetical protein